MRPVLALVTLLLGLNSAAPEPEYSSLSADYLQNSDNNAVRPSVEIETSVGKSDRLTALTLAPDLRIGAEAIPVITQRFVDTAQPKGPKADKADKVAKTAASQERIVLASADPDDSGLRLTSAYADPDDAGLHHAPASADVTTDQMPDVSVDDLCYALLNSAQDNELPVPFFANLIWQESRLQNDAVSPAGAQGIAQFMPETAAQSGLDDPFDPLKAIPASARLLRELRQQFGNLGFAAAAYNAGPRRVVEWLRRHHRLPRETRDYVVRITGRSTEQWRKTPPSNGALAFTRRLPCRSLPAFADLEQERVEQAKLDGDQTDATSSTSQQTVAARRGHGRAALRKYTHAHNRPEAAHVAGHKPAAKHQANRKAHPAQDKRKSA
jgi:Transglycosylase SLT domain